MNKTIRPPKQKGGPRADAPLYKPEFVWQVEFLKKAGIADDQIAEFFNVNPKTISAWKRKHAAFGKAVEQGRDVAVNRLINAVYHSATGYFYPETKFFVVNGALVEKTVVSHRAPDVTAAMFLLKNWRPNDWKDKRDDDAATDAPLDSVAINIHVQDDGAGDDDDRREGE